ncbi:nickel-responsive transcriptional regulator NikR [Candidatus Bathyarchaeota archaeon]|nr:MAG: nickel-responsive transcriptional regulator NikR [Candidatus Bathyarchaeota archaeon]
MLYIKNLLSFVGVVVVRKGVSRISISVPPELLKEFDLLVKEIGYDRSKAVQKAMRNFITEYKFRELEGEGVGALLVLYDHEIPGLDSLLTDVQHSYEDVITSSMHIHLDKRRCLEIIAVKGELGRIQDLAKKLTSKRGVIQFKQAVIAK